MKPALKALRWMTGRFYTWCIIMDGMSGKQFNSIFCVVNKEQCCRKPLCMFTRNTLILNFLRTLTFALFCKPSSASHHRPAGSSIETKFITFFIGRQNTTGEATGHHYPGVMAEPIKVQAPPQGLGRVQHSVKTWSRVPE